MLQYNPSMKLKSHPFLRGLALLRPDPGLELLLKESEEKLQARLGITCSDTGHQMILLTSSVARHTCCTSVRSNLASVCICQLLFVHRGVRLVNAEVLWFFQALLHCGTSFNTPYYSVYDMS